VRGPRFSTRCFYNAACSNFSFSHRHQRQNLNSSLSKFKNVLLQRKPKTSCLPVKQRTYQPLNSALRADSRSKLPDRHPHREVAPLIVKKNSDNRPYIRVNLFGTVITALFDSGATSSIVGNQGLSILQKFNLKIHSSIFKSVYTADGKDQKVTGLVYLPIYIGKVCQILEACVVPSLNHSFIFGSDFAEKFELIIDYKHDRWDIQSDLVCEKICLLSGNELIEKVDDLNSDLQSLSDLNCQQKSEAEQVINSFQEISGESHLGRTNKVIMQIDTADAKPFKRKQYPLSPYMLEILNKELDKMLELGVVEPSNSPWCSPVLLVRKANGEYRFCFDGRSLNAVTKHHSYPLPNMDSILNRLRNSNFISSIDLRHAFWQIPLDDESKEKTAFAVAGRGLFQFTVNPFGLVNSAAYQQKLVDCLFNHLEPNVFTYLDDIIIVSSTFDEHLELLIKVKEILSEANLTVNLKKCKFFRTSLKYLGFVIGKAGLHTDPEKVSTIVNYPRPKTVTEVKRFLGMCSWFRRFIENFASTVSPLNDLLRGKRKKQQVDWTPVAENAFLAIKKALVSAPILSQPDFSQPFVIQTDASDTGIGGFLSQNLSGEERVIAYASRALSKSERNFSVTERECLAVIFCIEKFRPYVEGVQFTVKTDHHSLLWLNNIKNPSGRLARWAVRLRQFSFTLVHRKGLDNVVPDALSRIPYPEINLIEITPSENDAWYRSMLENIQQSPNSYPQWKIDRGQVFKFIPCQLPVKSNIREWKLLVPKSQRLEVIKSCHDPAICAHLGFYKSLARVQESYYWPNMRHDILKYVRRCKICGAQKLSFKGRMGLFGNEKHVQYPWQIIAVDLVGPLPRSTKGFTHILTVTDWFTKYTLVHPLRKATAPSIVKFIEDEVFLIFGACQFVICDNGSQFAGHVFKQLMDKYQVQKIWFTPRYSPQCNPVERCHLSLVTSLRCYVKDHKDWDKELAKVRQAINTAKHEVTGFSPSFLNFGRYVPMSGKYYGKIETTKNLEITPGDRKAYAEDISHLPKIFQEVQEKLHTAYTRNAKAYNLRKRDTVFQNGEKVWRKNKVLSDASAGFASKLAPKFVLCKVRTRINRVTYVLENIDGTDAGTWHIKDLKTYFGSNSDISVG